MTSPFTKITVDIYSTTSGEAYRLYFGDTLLTERTFMWDPQREYVQEFIIVQVDLGSEHTISVQSVNNIDCFSMKNVTVNGVKTERTFHV